MPNTALGSADANKIHARFKIDVFDFFFAWVMGAQTHGGSETGELLVIASQIKERDPESWTKSFTDMAERLGARGKASLHQLPFGQPTRVTAARQRVLPRCVGIRQSKPGRTPVSRISSSCPQLLPPGRDAFRSTHRSNRHAL